MAVNFQLIPRCDPEHGPIALQLVDIGLCQYLNRTVHPKWWCCQWYDAIGFWLAYGYSMERIRRQLIEYAMKSRHDDNHGYCHERVYLDLLIILQFIDDNYIVNHWYGR